MSAVAHRQRDLVQEHLEQARRWRSHLVESAQDIQQWVRMRRRDPNRGGAPQLDAEVIRRVFRATAARTAAIERRTERLRLLGPAQRNEALEQVIPTATLTESLLAEVDRDIFSVSEPEELTTWADAAVSMAQRLWSRRPTAPERRDLLLRSFGARIETRLILGWRPGEIEEDLPGVERLIKALDEPPEDPAVVILLWRALGRYCLRVARPEAMAFLDLALDVAKAYGFYDEQILVEIVTAEGEWMAGRPGRAEAHLALARKLTEETGGEPVSSGFVLMRQALAAAMAGDPPLALQILAALEGEPIPPEGSLARRERRLRRLVVAYAQTDLAALEKAARELSLPGDAWGHWWATQTRLERLRRSLERKGQRWEQQEYVALLMKATPTPEPRAARALEVLETELTEETLRKAMGVLHELGPRGTWKGGDDGPE